jgi:hypothetical protein
MERGLSTSAALRATLNRMLENTASEIKRATVSNNGVIIWDDLSSISGLRMEWV